LSILVAHYDAISHLIVQTFVNLKTRPSVQIYLIHALGLAESVPDLQVCLNFHGQHAESIFLQNRPHGFE